MTVTEKDQTQKERTEDTKMSQRRKKKGENVSTVNQEQECAHTQFQAEGLPG